MSVVVALAPLSVRGHEGGGVGSCGRPLGSLLVFLSRWGRSRSSDRSRSWRECSRSRCDRFRSWDRDRSRRDRLCRARWWSVDRSRSHHWRTHFFPAHWGERRDRERSHALPHRSRDRSRSGERLPGSCLLASGGARTAGQT